MNTKKRIGLTYKKKGEILYELNKELYQPIEDYDKENHKEKRIIRDKTIKDALKKSMYELLKAEEKDCLGLLSAYINIKKTMHDYKYYVGRNYIWCDHGASYTPYRYLVEEFDDEWDLLVKITDKAWKWVAGDYYHLLDQDKYNNAFEKFKNIKDKALFTYLEETKQSRDKLLLMNRRYHVERNKLYDRLGHRVAYLIHVNTPIPTLKHLCLEKIKGFLLPFMESYDYESEISLYINDTFEMNKG